MLGTFLRKIKVHSVLPFNGDCDGVDVASWDCGVGVGVNGSGGKV